MKGDLKSKFEKEGKLFERKLNPHRSYISKKWERFKVTWQKSFTCKKRWSSNDQPFNFIKRWK